MLQSREHGGQRHGRQIPRLPAIASFLSMLYVASAASASKPGAPGYDLRPAAQRAQAARDLLSEDAAKWREAQLRLASAGPPVLATLEQRALLHSARGRERVTEVLRLALLLSVPWREMHLHPALRSLIKDHLSRGAKVVASLPLRSLDEQGGMMEFTRSTEKEPEPRPPTARELVAPLGGFAVPELLDRLHDSRPEERAATCRLLKGLLAVAQIEALQSLYDDPHEFSWWHDDHETRHRVGDIARETAAEMEADRTDRSRFELPLRALATSWTLGPDDAGLLNGLREAGHTQDATSWDNWWNRARPAWRAWWELAATSRLREPNVWNNILRELESRRGKGTRPTTR